MAASADTTQQAPTAARPTLFKVHPYPPLNFDDDPHDDTVSVTYVATDPASNHTDQGEGEGEGDGSEDEIFDLTVIERNIEELNEWLEPFGEQYLIPTALNRVNENRWRSLGEAMWDLKGEAHDGWSCDESLLVQTVEWIYDFYKDTNKSDERSKKRGHRNDRPAGINHYVDAKMIRRLKEKAAACIREFVAGNDYEAHLIKAHEFVGARMVEKNGEPDGEIVFALILTRRFDLMHLGGRAEAGDVEENAAVAPFPVAAQTLPENFAADWAAMIASNEVQIAENKAQIAEIKAQIAENKAQTAEIARFEGLIAALRADFEANIHDASAAMDILGNNQDLLQKDLQQLARRVPAAVESRNSSRPSGPSSAVPKPAPAPTAARILNPHAGVDAHLRRGASAKRVLGTDTAPAAQKRQKKQDPATFFSPIPK